MPETPEPVASNPPTTTAQLSENTTQATTSNEAPPSTILTAEEPTQTGAPEAYSDFKVPDGYTLDKAVVDEASPLFKEMNLTQDQAQKLADFFIKHNQASVNKLYNEFSETWKGWQNESKAWLASNGGESQVKATIGRALNQIFQKDGSPDSEAIEGFRKAMELTRAGDNPYFVRALSVMAKAFVEPRQIQGNGPSPLGQTPPNSSQLSPAERMYPGGPRTGPFIAPQPQSG